MIKPCPFCGGKARVIRHMMIGTETFSVQCRECKCETWLYFTDRKEAERVWNTRKEAEE